MTKIIQQNFVLVEEFTEKKRKKTQKQKKKTEQQAEQTHNLPVSILGFISKSNLFSDLVYMLSYGESKSIRTSYMLYEV